MPHSAAIRSVLLCSVALASACREPSVPADRAALDSSAATGGDARASATTTPAHPAHVSIVSPGEPGAPLEVSGTVFQPDGTTPAPGVTIYVYQTDVTGLYGTGDFDAPRLRGWMTSDAEGKYSFRTIRPASYPGETIAAHIHFQLWSERWPAQYSEDVNFDDDPLLSGAERERSRRLGRFGCVRTSANGADGVLRCTHDLRLKPKGDVFEDNIMHGQRDEPRR